MSARLKCSSFGPLPDMMFAAKHECGDRASSGPPHFTQSDEQPMRSKKAVDA
jgi:hypothetical protein